jgi:hypothetical protein
MVVGKIGAVEDDEAAGVHRGGESFADERRGEKALGAPFLSLRREKKEGGGGEQGVRSDAQVEGK